MSECCLKRRTLTPPKGLEPNQVLFENGPILQLSAAPGKKKQKRFYMLLLLCSTQFQV